MFFFQKAKLLTLLFLLFSSSYVAAKITPPESTIDNFYLFKEGVLRKDYKKIMSSISSEGLTLYSVRNSKYCLKHKCGVKYSLGHSGDLELETTEEIKDWYSNVFTESLINKLLRIQESEFFYNGSWWATYWQLGGDGGYLIVFDEKNKIRMLYNDKAVIPSFNCSKAGSVVEKEICSDLVLSVKDRELSEEYSFARGVVTGEEFETLKSNQYKFLKERNECPKNKSKTLKSCISTAVDNRISEPGRKLQMY
ncbi:lysozyme inhibitor LprI family protein [Endozoicomonas sp. ALB115]|uniref:lysozyme inhibitor LprI family protein n=1 Tax=Endozoicomonas sp. ALB115 TaxID=3403074 RepID=UPI003BB68FBC